VIGLFGGAFDPPHNGHVELLRTAIEALGLSDAFVIVAGDPAHKAVVTPAVTRFMLARAAFPDTRVLLDDHPRTVEMLRAHPEWEGAVFLLGADQFFDLLSWEAPEEVLERVRLGVATRPGYPQARLDSVLGALAAPERVVFFELEPMPIASRELRARLDEGEDVHDFVPPAVWALIERDSLYGRGYTELG
jgi:nicotinate-nucleotide adenylyltransferase